MDNHQKIIELKRKINHDDFRRQEKEIKEQNRKKKREAQAPDKKRKFNVINFIFTCFLLYFAYTAFNQYMTMHDLNKQIEEKKMIKAQTEKKASELKQDVEKIGDENALMGLVEEVARDQYKMVRPNEIIYIDKNKTENKFIGGIGPNQIQDENTENKENTETEE